MVSARNPRSATVKKVKAVIKATVVLVDKS